LQRYDERGIEPPLIRTGVRAKGNYKSVVDACLAARFPSGKGGHSMCDPDPMVESERSMGTLFLR
jgi:hypothetical protein